jgi:hypothetical protein
LVDDDVIFAGFSILLLNGSKDRIIGIAIDELIIDQIDKEGDDDRKEDVNRIVVACREDKENHCDKEDIVDGKCYVGREEVVMPTEKEKKKNHRSMAREEEIIATSEECMELAHLRCIWEQSH